MNNLSWKILAVLAFALVIAGCGPGGPRLYKAGGTVTYNGKPVEGAQVTFGYPDGNFANGVTDAAGKFQLVYMGRVGALPGKCVVAVSKVSTPAPSGNAPPAGADPAEMAKAMEEFKKSQDKAGRPKSEIPEKFADPKISGLTYEVTTDEKANDFNIELKD